MKRFLTIAGLVLLALLLLFTNGVLYERYRDEKKARIEAEDRLDSIKPGKIDTAWLPGKVEYVPANPLKPVVHDQKPDQVPPDTLSCKGMEYSDSLIKKDLWLWYTIKIENGCVLWVDFRYEVKTQSIRTDNYIPLSPQLVPEKKTWHAMAMATGWSDQSMTFGAGFTLPDGWGIHVQVDPFRKPAADPVRTRWGAGITYNLR